MTRIILKALNTPLLIFFVSIGIAVQTSLFSSWPLIYFQPDIVLLAVIWCGLRRTFTEGGVITLMIAEISEIHSAAPQGIYLMSYLAIYLLIRASARFLVIPTLYFYSVLTLVSSIIWKILSLILLYLLGGNLSQWQNILAFLTMGAATESIFSMWVFRWAERFDWITFKNAHAERAMDDELQLDSEGF